jgi:hypothetical protein
VARTGCGRVWPRRPRYRPWLWELGTWRARPMTVEAVSQWAFWPRAKTRQAFSNTGFLTSARISTDADTTDCSECLILGSFTLHVGDSNSPALAYAARSFIAVLSLHYIQDPQDTFTANGIATTSLQRHHGGAYHPVQFRQGLASEPHLSRSFDVRDSAPPELQLFMRHRSRRQGLHSVHSLLPCFPCGLRFTSRVPSRLALPRM